jgi:hypothetical protein
MWIVRIASGLYLALLTVLLLAPDPAALLGMRRVPGVNGGLGVHFAAFLVLGALVGASRLPARRPWVIVPLAIYAVGIELAQGLVPRRTVQWEDLVENVGGLAAGILLGQTALWLIDRLSGRTRRRTRRDS